MQNLLHFSIMRSSSSSTTAKPQKFPNSNPNPNPNSIQCKHSPSATLDILILILVLFSGIFLLTSYFSYIIRSLSLLLANVNFNFNLSGAYIWGFLTLFVIVIVMNEVCWGPRSRKCEKLGCKGLKKAMEFDLQLQSEECVKTASFKGRKDIDDVIDKLPWKGGSEENPDYECLRAELRKMAPVNGRAVLLFRAKCGCPVAKLEGWGPKKPRRHKKALANVPANGGGDHR